MAKPLESRQLAECYRLCFSSPNGHEVLRDLINRYVARLTFVESPQINSFNDGKRAVVIELANLSKVNIVDVILEEGDGG